MVLMRRPDTILIVIIGVAAMASLVLTAVLAQRAGHPEWQAPETPGRPDTAAYHVAAVLQEARDITEQAAARARGKP